MKNWTTIVCFIAAAFLLGLLIGAKTQEYPTTPSDWWCEQGYPMLQEGWQFCKVKEF